MRRFLLLAFLSAVTALVCGGAASACINDRDTGRTEREFQSNYEFKSRYEEKEVTPPAPSSAEDGSGDLIATWSGAGLLLLAAGTVAVNVRRAGRP
jgi:hypothetical protein